MRIEIDPRISKEFIDAHKWYFNTLIDQCIAGGPNHINVCPQDAVEAWFAMDESTPCEIIECAVLTATKENWRNPDYTLIKITCDERSLRVIAEWQSKYFL